MAIRPESARDALLSANRTWIDRRARLRFVVNPATARHLVAAVGDTFWPARVLDLSTSGIRLSLRRRFEPGTSVLLELANGRRVFSCVLALRVLHVAEQPNGAYILGGEFGRKLTQKELMDLLW
jgi:PilZ domain